ncbi:MAG: glutathione S-transferase N-terminal domain-containing protein [Acidiferrobacter sp.]
MILFYAPGTSSLAPHILLREADIPFTLEKVDIASKRWSGGDFNTINPKSYVPALQTDDGDILTECAVILQFIADLKPEREFLPTQDLRARYHALEWLNFIATEIHGNFITPERHNGVAANFLAKTAEGQEATRIWVAPRLAYVDRMMGEKLFLMGPSFTAPDSYLFVMLTWAKRLALDLAPWRHLSAYFARVGAMPSVRETLAVEGPPHSLRPQ